MDRRSARTSESGQAVADIRDDSLRHVAFFYRDQAERLAQILGLVRAGFARGEPTLVALPGDETPLLAEQLDGEPGELRYADIGDVGRNPARLIPEVRAFIDKHADQRVLVIGEACWPGRSPAELREAARHEALMNLAFARSAATITCAYDATRLPPSAITDATWTHPGRARRRGRDVPPAAAATARPRREPGLRHRPGAGAAAGGTSRPRRLARPGPGRRPGPRGQRSRREHPRPHQLGRHAPGMARRGRNSLPGTRPGMDFRSARRAGQARPGRPRPRPLPGQPGV